MKTLITGAAGFIGSHVAEALAGDGHAVTGIDNFNTYYDERLKRLNAKAVKDSGVELLEQDLAAESVELGNYDVVIHFAAQPGISADVPFVDYERNNIQVTENLITAANSCETPPYVIYISTSSVYGLEATGAEDTEPKPASDYGVTKLAAEQLVLSAVRQGGLRGTSLRLFSVYGPRERPEKLFPKLLLAAEKEASFPLYKGSEEHVRSFTYVGDVVSAVVHTIERREECDGEIINIGNDTTRTTGEAIAAVEEAVGKRILIDTQPARVGDQKKTAANIEKARRLLDYSPQTKLEEGVRSHAQWFQENNIADLS